MDRPFALIVEDDRDIAALFRHVIDMAGFRTEVISDGLAARIRLSQCRPDIVLLDLTLPGMSGSQILAQVSQDPRLDQTWIVVVTAHAHIAAALPVQPDFLLLKPVSLEQLTGLIDRIHVAKNFREFISLPPEPYDLQTGLYNRSFFVHRLESSLKRAQESEGYLFAVFLFKLDAYRKIKTPAEIRAWERVQREIAGYLRRILRPTDTLARFGKDTFYILVESIPDGEICVQIANRVQEKLYRNITDIGSKIKIPIRIGILLCDNGYKNVEEILGDAKYAQSLASAQGEEYSQYYYQFSVKK